MSGLQGLVNIGDFARATGLTPKALRLYDDLGLLPPAEVDAHSGYRRYAPDQVERARLVASLRLVGMPLARIREVLDMSAAHAAAEVETYWRQVEADTATRRTMVSTLVHAMRNEAPPMNTSTTTLHAELGVSHEQGGRPAQQDAVMVTPELVAVADGFGERDDLAGAALTAYAAGGLGSAIHEVVAELPASGTTLTAVDLHGSTARITHVGDGRVHLVRDGEVRRVTHDHTVVAAMIESGHLTPDEARSHEHRSVLNRALVPGVVADELSLDLLPGDRLVVTTDGIHSWVDDLDALITADASPQQVADAVAAAVAASGEPDNHTIVVADLTAG
ncbi:protein phosphatase [Nocardioides albertanoniae]|uniref:Protein phosphatase n=1 Tax=Nocardioides albertanoniae TaxID=1175486 RepID=A0A543ADU4_9ACTN|nr:MerR family transcriptional regulator [Nocardioides albertanoniae]TQL70752.1 protein phosphatase [Nocardioides albertanoniae]